MKKFILPVLAFALFACNNDDDNSGGNNNPPPPPTGYYIGMTADGSETLLQEGDIYQHSISNGSSFGEICTYDFGAGLSSFQNSSTHHQAQISFENHYVSADCNADEVFTTLFETGEYSFGNGNNQGIVIYFAEPGSNYFTSDSGDQTGSTFEVTEVTPIETTDIFGTQESVEVKGTFSCKVYNPENPAENITLENGVFSLVLFPTN